MPRKKNDMNIWLEEIEEALIGSPRSCELDKAWEGIQYCLGGGQWNEDNCIPTNIVFGGEGLFNTGYYRTGTCMASDNANLQRGGRTSEIYAGRKIKDEKGQDTFE